MNDKTNNEFIELPEYLKENSSSSEDKIIYPNYYSSFNSIIDPQKLNMNENVSLPLTPGSQVNSEEMCGNLELIDDVIDTLYPHETLTFAPGMYVIKSKNSLTQESGYDRISGAIKRSKRTTKANIILLATMFLGEVKKFERYYLITGQFRTIQKQIIPFQITIDYQKYQNNFYQAFIENNIDCFNNKFNPKEISKYLKIILDKKSIQMPPCPQTHGFHFYQNMWHFISYETCYPLGFPLCTMELSRNVQSENTQNLR